MRAVGYQMVGQCFPFCGAYLYSRLLVRLFCDSVLQSYIRYLRSDNTSEPFRDDSLQDRTFRTASATSKKYQRFAK